MTEYKTIEHEAFRHLYVKYTILALEERESFLLKQAEELCERFGVSEIYDEHRLDCDWIYGPEEMATAISVWHDSKRFQKSR